MNIRSTTRLSRGIQRVGAARRMMFDTAPQPQQIQPLKPQEKPEPSFAATLASVMEGTA